MKGCVRGFGAVMVAVLLFGASAAAQDGRSQVTAQATATIIKDSTGQGISQEATRSGGFLVGYSYQFHRWAGVEANYGYTRDSHRYAGGFGPSEIRSDIHQVTGSFVLHVPLETSIVRPYALAGAGALIFNPRDEVTLQGADQQARGVFLYGGGVNFDLVRNFGVRAEYRGFLYKAPDFKSLSLDVDKFTHLAQPSAGVYFRF